MMLYHEIKFGCKRISNSEDIVEIGTAGGKRVMNSENIVETVIF